MTHKQDMQDYRSDIRSISKQVKILNYETYQIQEKPFPVTNKQAYTSWLQPLQDFGRNTGETKLMKNNLHQHLAQAMYMYFYCQGTAKPAQLNFNEAKIDPVERKEKIAVLSALNTTVDRLDPFWKIYSIEENGACYVMKNSEVRYLIPNEWEFSDKTESQPKIGTVVTIKIKKEDLSAQSHFYYVWSSALIAQQAELVRFYFNTNFEGACVLVKEITEVFNYYRMPFMFKCLNHPALFTRADSAVLYIDKSQYRFACSLLRLIIPKIKPGLKDNVPLFTRTLLPGLSFSEDPGNNKSFGMQCCELLSEGLISAFEKNLLTDNKKYDHILNTFSNNGIDIDKIYLKMNSHFPYDFSPLSF